jgi:hypothetical protein
VNEKGKMKNEMQFFEERQADGERKKVLISQFLQAII